MNFKIRGLMKEQIERRRTLSSFSGRGEGGNKRTDKAVPIAPSSSLNDSAPASIPRRVPRAPSTGIGES